MRMPLEQMEHDAELLAQLLSERYIVVVRLFQVREFAFQLRQRGVLPVRLVAHGVRAAAEVVQRLHNGVLARTEVGQVLLHALPDRAFWAATRARTTVDGAVVA